jgi:hypothetical protein
VEDIDSDNDGIYDCDVTPDEAEVNEDDGSTCFITVTKE